MNKVALFGGTFDPVHRGHMACVQHLVENMDFSQVFLIPTNQNPLKADQKPASTAARLKMIELALADYSDGVIIDDYELGKESPAYTVETLQRYLKTHAPEELFLVMGIDTFQDFDQWKNFRDILTMTNLLVVSRPPYRRPLSIDEFPAGLRPLVHSYERGYALLESGRTIEFVAIKTDDISSSLVRKKLKAGKNLDHLLSIDVERYILENDVYPSLKPGSVDFLQLTLFVGRLLSEKAMNCSAYDFTGQEKLFDYTLIASAQSTKQSQSLANIIRDAVKEEYGIVPFGSEGREDGRWVILDYGALIIHLFYDFVRQEYHLEDLWKDGKRLELK